MRERAVPEVGADQLAHPSEHGALRPGEQPSQHRGARQPAQIQPKLVINGVVQRDSVRVLPRHEHVVDQRHREIRRDQADHRSAQRQRESDANLPEARPRKAEQAPQRVSQWRRFRQREFVIQLGVGFGRRGPIVRASTELLERGHEIVARDGQRQRVACDQYPLPGVEERQLGQAGVFVTSERERVRDRDAAKAPLAVSHVQMRVAQQQQPRRKAQLVIDVDVQATQQAFVGK